MQVKVVSREIIRPSPSIPPHPKTFKLSLLDQFSDEEYIPLIYFYHLKKTDDFVFDPKNSISKLKKSLSETLSRFYLLAGRIKDNESSIDCNDEGALFFEANINCIMADILKNPQYELLSNLLPCSPICTKPMEEHEQVVAQFNTFSCGGIAISFCFLHKLIDATTMSCFLRSWASINRGSLDPSLEDLSFDYNELSSIFPHTKLLPLEKDFPMLPNIPEPKRCIQRFVFAAKAITELKTAAKSIDVPNPTCVEVVSAFIWKHVMEAATSSRLGCCSKQEPYFLKHLVNMRKRMKPALPECSIGNFLWYAISQYKAAGVGVRVELNELVNLVRRSIKEIDGNYIQKLTRRGEEGTIEATSMLRGWKKELICFGSKNSIMFSSWRNMNLNDLDFGWGKPIWVGFARPPNITPSYNITFLLETTSGDGIEAWMVHDEAEMKILKQNPEFLKFTFVNPSIHLQ